MRDGLGVGDANRRVDVNQSILHNRDVYKLPTLERNGFVSIISTVLYEAMKCDDRLYDGSLLSDLLSGQQSRCYTTKQLQQFLLDLQAFTKDWSESDKDLASTVLKDIHNEQFPDGSKLSTSSTFNHWLGVGINQSILAILSIRAKNWLAGCTYVEEKNTVSMQVKKLVGSSILSLLGWSIEGSIDSSLAKSVIIVAPHNTGMFDVVLGWSVRAQQPIPNNTFMAKKEVYDDPLYGGFLRSLGAIRVDRENPDGLVHSVVQNMRHQDQSNLVIAPEGTRKAGVPWKTGFYRIVHQLQVPLVMVGFDYAHKKICISDPVIITGDPVKDERDIKLRYEKNIPHFSCNLTLPIG